MKKKIIISSLAIFIILVLTLLILANVKTNKILKLSKKSSEIKAEYENEGYVTVEFKDEKMAKAIYIALEANAFPKNYQYLEGTKLPISQEVLNNKTQLTLQTKESERITNIEGIEKFANLTDLKLANNLIEDISPIGNLTKLTSLDLSLNENIKDISCLRNNTELQTLDLTGNKITDLTGILELNKLKTLEIGKNQVTSAAIEKITGLKMLEKLNLQGNKIDDIEPILKFHNLKDLNLYGNLIETLTDISTLRKLEKLNLGNNKIKNYEIQSVFQTVMISYYTNENDNRIIVGEYDDKIGNWVYNSKYNEEESYNYQIETVPKLDKLYYLNVEINSITDLLSGSGIAYMKGLKEIYAQKNGITYISDIYNLTNLETINLNDNEIEDITPFFETYTDEKTEKKKMYLEKIKSISLAANKIEYIFVDKEDEEGTHRYSFANFDNLKVLNLSENYISLISTIAYKQFTSIQLFDQRVSLTVMKRDEGDDFQELFLPQIFLYSNLKETNVYSQEEFSYNNCSKTSEDEKITDCNLVFIDSNKLSINNENATIKINGGAADGTILTINSTPSTDTYGGLETIRFTDNNLFNEVRNKLLEYTENDVIEEGRWGCYRNDTYNVINIYDENGALRSFEKLEVSNKNISSLDGIKRLKALNYLDISNNEISDIGEISLLPSLNTLNISANKIENLSEFKYTLGIANRKNKQPKISNNIESYTNLNELKAYTNKIDNIEAISKCTNITKLNLLQNNITDITALKDLIYLTELNLIDNYIDEIDTLENLKELKNLYLGNNHKKIEDKDLVHISKLPVLKNLELSNNYLKDVSALNSIKSLETLDLNTNNIEDINSIKDIKRLGYLDLSKNKIVDLTGINRLTQLTTLKLNGNRIKDVTNLSNLTSLTTVDLSYNKIEDISTIETLSSMYNLDDIKLNDQSITIELTEEQTIGEEEIQLPELLSKATITNNLIYTPKDFEINNCTVDTNNKTIKVSDLGSKIAWVKIKGGLATDSRVAISEPLRGTIEYSTKDFTKEDVVATVSFNRSGVNVINNDGNKYTFKNNGEFVFEFEDTYGFAGTITAKVDWIDKEAPVITGVQNEQTYNAAVTPVVTDEHLDTIELVKDGNKIEGYTSGKEITENGEYTLTAKDKAGNITVVSFKIDPNGQARVLINIEIISEPNKKIYKEGEKFDRTGMKIQAVYSDGSKEEVTDYTVIDEDKSLQINTTSVKITYTENGQEPKEVQQSITVVPQEITKKELVKIEITNPPTKTSYVEGENFDKAGMIVTAIYNDASTKNVTGYRVTDGENLQIGKTNVTITYTEDEKTESTVQKITVLAKETERFNVEVKNYEIKTEGNVIYIKGINPQTTVEMFKKNIETNGTIKIKKNTTEISDTSTKIGTGMTLEISFNNEKKEYTLVVNGDTNGDGESNIKDMLQINKHRLNKLLLKDIYLEAADVNEDGKVDIKDMLKINKYRLGKITVL